MRHWKGLILLILTSAVLAYLLVLHFTTDKPEPTTSSGNDYVGDLECRSCHSKEFAEWKTSDHYLAMLPASDSTVKGDFSDIVYKADGVESRFYKTGDDFFINTQGPDGKNHDYKVLYTFGHYPLQQYLVAFPGGRMQVPRVSWDTKKKVWFHQYAGEQIAASDWLHWSRDAQNWNTMCATCHSTNLKKGYLAESDSFHTTWSSINVSCESCHGPGKLHSELAKTPDYEKHKAKTGSMILKAGTQAAQLYTCTPCHSRKADISADLVASAELLDNHIPELPTTENFHADGQVDDEDYIYASFLQSKMMQKGVTCSNCHNSHTGKIKLEGNQLCTQCHEPAKYDQFAHHFHEMKSEGASCVSCHMPGKVYMGNDLRHDHSMRIPRPDLSVKYGTPNACNNCHTNKPVQWSALAVEKHYGRKPPYHFSEDLIPGSRLDASSEPHLLSLLKNAETPVIIKATALSYLAAFPTRQSAEELLKALSHKEAMIRYQALRSLSGFPMPVWITPSGPMLSDPVRAVRIAAADLFMTVPTDQLPANIRAPYQKALQELKQYVHYQADFADGNVLIADHYLRLSDFRPAEKFYKRALKKDSLLNYARLNLAVTLSAQQRNEDALHVLKTAVTITPDNDRALYNLALLQIEMNDSTGAIKSFERAVNLQSNNPRLYYNYGLLVFHQGKTARAESILRKGLKQTPHDEDLNYAMAYLYYQLGKKQNARPYIEALMQLNPANPAYEPLFRWAGPR